MIFLGYAVTLGYVFFLIFALGPMVQKHTNTETSRKLIHTGLFLVWVLIDVFFKDTVHQIIIPVIFIVLNALSYKYDLYKSVERDTGNHKGTIYFAVAITAVMSAAYFVHELYYPSGIAAFCLTFGDGAAALIGYNTSTRKLRDGKSVSGFLGCIASSALSLLVFRAVYPVSVSVPAVLIVAVSAAVLELVGAGLDNFSVTFGSFFLSWLLINYESPAMLIGMGTALVIFFVVFFSGSIDYYGALLSMVMVFCFYYFGGTFGLLYLLGTFFTIFFVAVVRKRLRPELKKEKSRRFIQILINGGLGCLFVVLYGLSGELRCLVISVVAIGGCFVDSLSSDVGVLSRAKPYDPLKRRHVESGISGGMSRLGTAAALIGSALIGLCTALALRLTAAEGLLVFALVFLQTLVDTVLGSAVQVKFSCPVCGCVTEKKEHCGKPAAYLSGVRFIDNNWVNALSSIIITAAALLIFKNR